MPESVWDYPRPPRLEATSKQLQVVFNGRTIADTTRGYRVLETSHPPTYYIPLADIDSTAILPNMGRSSMCEWKGRAAYYDITVNHRTATCAAWRYPSPTDSFTPIKDCLCFYPSQMDAVFVDGEQARAQEGDFYGGWITSDIEGPFKGAPGTMGW